MSIQNRSTERTYGFLRPLTKRLRPASVSSELVSLDRLPRTAVLTRCQATTTHTRLSVESLVAVVRGFSIAGDRQAASTAFECLVRRVSGWIDRKVRSWGFSGDEAEEAIRDGIVILWEYVADCSPKEELWECNFTTCFRMRIVAILAERAKRRLPTTSLGFIDDDGEEQRGVAAIPDDTTEESFSIVECREIIEALSRISMSVAQAVFLRMEGLQVNEIAERFGVTTRTIRNWMASARDVLSGVDHGEAIK